MSSTKKMKYVILFVYLFLLRLLFFNVSVQMLIYKLGLSISRQF